MKKTKIDQAYINYLNDLKLTSFQDVILKTHQDFHMTKDHEIIGVIKMLELGKEIQTFYLDHKKKTGIKYRNLMIRTLKVMAESLLDFNLLYPNSDVVDRSSYDHLTSKRAEGNIAFYYEISKLLLSLNLHERLSFLKNLITVGQMNKKTKSYAERDRDNRIYINVMDFILTEFETDQQHYERVTA